MKLLIYLSIGILLLPVAIVAATTAPHYHQVKRIAVGGEGGWDYLTFDSAAHRLYVGRSTRVIAVDVQQGAVVGEVANTPGVHGIALAPRLHRGFTSNGRDNSVTVFDMKTYKTLARIPVGNGPDAIIYDSAVNRVFTMNGESQDVTAIDAGSLKVVGTMALGGRPEFAVADEQGRLFINLEDQNSLVSCDSRTLKVKNRWALAPGEEPSGLAMDRAHRRLFSVCSNDMMVVMDADTGHVIATPAIGKGPDAAAFDPGTGLAFSSNGRDGTMTIVHEDGPAKFRVVATVQTQRGARTMALDPRTHRVYLAAARFLPQTDEPGAPRKRPNMVPGSFEILVFAQ